MTRPPGTRPGSMRSRPTQLTHKGCHARVAAHRRTLGITQVAFSLAQACLFRVMREPQQSKAPPPATGAPPCLHVSPCASIVVALMTCSRALSPGGASSPAPFLLAGPAFVRVATEGTPHTVRTLRLPVAFASNQTHTCTSSMRIRSGCKFGTHLLTTSLRSLRGSTPWWPAADFNGDLKVKTTGDRLHLFRRLKFEPAVGWHGSIGEHTFPPSNPRFLTRAATPHSHAAARDPHCG